MSKSTKVLGIDLGTTYSCVCCLNDYGKAEILRNSDDELTTPSVVWFSDAMTVVVGQQAKNMSIVDPNKVVSVVKRYMGNPEYRFSCDGKEYRAEEISAFILRKLTQDAWDRLGEEVRDVVITCPAYFCVQEREATKLAGQLAGLNVLQIINEPTAAAVAYGVDSIDPDAKKTVLVYDLGGGTFDATLISVEGRNVTHSREDEINVICTDGKHTLGGVDWDQSMVDLIVRHVCHNEGCDESLLTSPQMHQELFLLAERMKKQLTHQENAQSRLTTNSESFNVSISRKEFEENSSSLLNETLRFIDQLMGEARKKGFNKVDQVLLVGGSCRMPQVAKAVEQMMKMPVRIFDPDECIARGAAIMGFRKFAEVSGITLKTFGGTTNIQLLGKKGKETVVLPAIPKVTNVSSKSFGMSAHSSKTHELKLFNIIFKNDEVPIKKNRSFRTLVENQNSVSLDVYENDNSWTSEGDNNGYKVESGEKLWEGELKFPRPMPKGHPFDVCFHLDDSGCLQIYVKDDATNSEVRDSIQVGSIISKDDTKTLYNAQARMIVE